MSQVHFFAANVVGWATSSVSSDDAIKRVNEQSGNNTKIETMVYVIPHPDTTKYEIRFFAPVDVDAIPCRLVKVTRTGKIKELDPATMWPNLFEEKA